MSTKRKQPMIANMRSPVRCRCGSIYDLGVVTVTARYSDCSLWKAPCCGRVADDRKWKSLPDYTEIDERGFTFRNGFFSYGYGE